MIIYVFLENGFPIQHDQSIKQYRINVTKKVEQIDVEVPNSKFALKVHHDEDLSGKVTKNWTGIFPAEGLGFSSGAKISFGPPSFKQAAMTLPNDKVTQIFMMYP